MPGICSGAVTAAAAALKSPPGLPANTICGAWTSRFVTFISTSCIHKAYTLKSPEGLPANTICGAWASRLVTFVSTSCVHKTTHAEKPGGLTCKYDLRRLGKPLGDPYFNFMCA